MDLEKLKRNLLNQKPIETTEAQQCPHCGSYNTREDWYRDITIIDRDDYDTPIEICQFRTCEDCESDYTAYFTVDFTKSKKE